MNLINGESILRDILSGLSVTLIVSIVSLVIGAGLSIIINPAFN